MRVQVLVTLKDTIADPPGIAIQQALSGLGISVDKVRLGKVIIFDTENIEYAEEACDKLLVNPTIEQYEIVSCERV